VSLTVARFVMWDLDFSIALSPRSALAVGDASIVGTAPL
jgi:hypothetical protein